MTSQAHEVCYFVLPDAVNPCILARVRWPDVFEAISPTRADWQQDPGLFDLPYDPGRREVSAEQAEEIARAWGATLGPDEVLPPSLMRRMPANWSDPSRAEQRAWSIEFHSTRRKRRGLIGRLTRREHGASDANARRQPAEDVIDIREPRTDTLLPTKRP